MIELLAALLAQGSPAIAECGLAYETERYDERIRINDIRVLCDKAEIHAAQRSELQLFADQTVAAIDLDFEFPNYIALSDSVRFEHGPDDGWTVPPGQFLFRSELVFPSRLARMGPRNLACAWAGFPGPSGIADDVRIVCLLDGREGHPHSTRIGQEAMRYVIDSTRFIPAGLRYCYQDQVTENALVWLTDRAEWEDMSDRPPVEIDLPDLCTAGGEE